MLSDPPAIVRVIQKWAAGDTARNHSDKALLSRLLTSVLAAALGLLVLLFVVRALAYLTTGYDAITRLAIALVLIVAILLNRRGHYLFASRIVLFTSSVALFALAAMEQTVGRLSPLNYLIMTILFSSLFLPFVDTVIVVILQLAALLLLPLLVPTVPFSRIIAGPFSLTLTLSVFALVIAHHRNLLERNRQAQLAANERKLRGVLDNSVDAIRVIDEEGVIIEWNAANTSLTNIPPEKALGRHFWDVLHDFADESALIAETGLNLAGYQDMMQRFLRDGEMPDWLRSEEYTITRTGRTVQVNNTLVQSENGYLMSSILRDVTARKEVETRLRSLSKAIEHSPATVVITDTSGIIEYVNPKFTAITGYAAEEALGLNPRILKSDQTAPEVHKSLWEALTAGREWHGEFVNKKKNGDLYWEAAAISPIFDDAGQVTRFVAVKEDITDRKRTEAELARYQTALETQVEEQTAEVRESQQRYRALFEAANDAIFILSLEGVHIAANHTAYQMLGYEADELDGRSFRNIVAPDDLDQSEALLPRLLAGESIPIYERHFQRKNGEIIPVEINVLLVKDQAGSPLHIQSIVRDISERKQAEEALRNAYRQLMKLDDMKTEFINSVSHELRTPITNLKLYHHLLTANPDKSLEYAHTLQSQSSRLEEIVEGILFMQTVQQGLTEFGVATVSLDTLLAEGIRQARQRSEAMGIEITFFQQTKGIELSGDAALLKQALNLLLDNSIKYSGGPGVIEVSVTDAVRDGLPQVLITIANPTRDLTAEDVQRLFERFFRGSNALTMGVSGAGLGLSIARQIVERHQGQLVAAFDPEQTHTFTVMMRLPVGTP